MVYLTKALIKAMQSPFPPSHLTAAVSVHVADILQKVLCKGFLKGRREDEKNSLKKNPY